jgi:hypothetical protein
MSARIAHQLERARRALTLLTDTHTPIYRVEIDCNQARAIFQVGAGPFGWVCCGCGLDDRGPWTDYVAHLGGVELHRRVRTARHPKPFARRTALYAPVEEARHG